MMQKILVNNEALPLLRSGLLLKARILNLRAENYLSRIKKFEKKYKMKSDIFIKQYRQGLLGDDEIWLDWLFVYEAYGKIIEQRKIIAELSLHLGANMMHWVIDVSYIGEYKLKLTFENNECKIVDLLPHLEGKIFEPLKDISFFKSASLNKDIDTVVWPNNADFSPDFLYEIGQPVNN